MEGNAAATDAATGVFDGVYFAIIPSGGLSQQKSAEITKQLQDHGGRHCPLSSSELHHVTHLISTTSDFPAYHDAVEGFIHVVKPSWVTQSILKKRTANPRQYSPDPALFLSDVVVSCADDIPRGDKDAIVGGVQAMGGQYSEVLTKLVTHVVALTMKNPQCKMIESKNLQCVAVLPHWFDACLKLGKKIDPSPYVLPDPPIFEIVAGNGPARRHIPDLNGASQLTPEPPPSIADPISPSKTRRELSVFRNKHVLLYKDLGLSEHLTNALSDLISKGGGSMAKQVDEADMVVCHYRGSAVFKTASRAGKDVGNLNWFYYLVNHNTWTSPTRRLLHYPFPEGGISGFEKFKISVSNYSGEARIYLESLVKAAGGQFTKTLTQENTHLITAHTFSEKCNAAKEWNVQLINHLWLEESYARDKVQAVTNPRYTTFPQQTNLADVVGQTPIDRFRIEELYFPKESCPQAKGGTVEPASNAVDTPKMPGRKVGVKTPASHLKDVEKATPSSRGAKDRALGKLHAMAPDIALFEKETKRVGGVIYGGRRVTDPDRVQMRPKKRSSSDKENDRDPSEETGQDAPATEEEDEVEYKPRKKKRTSSKGATNSESDTLNAPIKLMITGWDKCRPTLQPKLKPLNISLTDKPHTSLDVIVAPRTLRTRKFLVGLAAAPRIAHPDWIEDMLKAGKRLPIEDYLLENRESKETSGLKEALARARVNRSNGGMLREWTIFCTENVSGGTEAFEEIARANGGVCQVFRGRETKVKRPQNAASNNADSDVDMDAESEEAEKLFLLSNPKDKHLWAKFKTLATEQGFEPKVVAPDWLLILATTQDITQWDDDWELADDME